MPVHRFKPRRLKSRPPGEIAQMVGNGQDTGQIYLTKFSHGEKRRELHLNGQNPLLLQPRNDRFRFTIERIGGPDRSAVNSFPLGDDRS